MSGKQFDWARRLSDLSEAEEPQARRIAGEILVQVVRLINDRERAEDERNEIREVLRAALSRLVLARATMRSYLKDGNVDTLEAWLLAAQECGWLDEIKAALDKNEEADAITDQGGSA